MAPRAFAESQCQSFGRRDPTPSEYRAVLEWMTAEFLEVLGGTDRGNDFRISRAEAWNIHFLESPPACNDPFGFRTRSRRKQRLGLLLLKHLPVAFGFASGKVNRVGSHPLAGRDRVVFLLGQVAGPGIDPHDGRRPFGEVAVIPDTWRRNLRLCKETSGGDEKQRQLPCPHNPLLLGDKDSRADMK